MSIPLVDADRAGFNSRSREGSDSSLMIGCMESFVSIHAPARGATAYPRHRLLRDEFQFTLPRGERPFRHSKLKLIYLVSIHAPARGATQAVIRNLRYLGVSIHAPARGATVKDNSTKFEGQVSIHAPARGATMRSIGSSPPRGCFNSRSREGSDLQMQLAM